SIFKPLLSAPYFLLRPHRWHFFSVPANKPRQFVRAPESRNKNARLCKQAKKPAEVKTVSPARNLDLIAGEKSKRRADAMNRWRVIEIPFEKKAQLVLSAAADGDGDMTRSSLTHEIEQCFIFNHPTVFRSDINIFGCDR